MAAINIQDYTEPKTMHASRHEYLGPNLSYLLLPTLAQRESLPEARGVREQQEYHALETGWFPKLWWLLAVAVEEALSLAV